MSSHSIKAPPSRSKSVSYESWLKEIKIWQLITDIPVDKQGPAIFLSLEGKAREAVLELEVSDISGVSGVANVIKKLDSIFERDAIQVAYECYDQFERYRRPENMSMSEYINEFDRLHNKTEAHGSSMSENILAYCLLKLANLSQHHEELARYQILVMTQ